MKESLEVLRKNRALTGLITRGEIPTVGWSSSAVVEYIFISIGIALVGFLIFTLCFGLIFSIFNLFIPIKIWVLSVIFTKIAIGLSLMVFWFYPVFFALYHKRKTGKFPSDDSFNNLNKRFHWLNDYLHKFHLVDIVEEVAEEEPKEFIQPDKFSLWLGESTGLLASLWHRAGLAPDQHISLDIADACQNILVLGGIGSGKTTCVMQPLLLQCLDQHCGGLIFDIKGDVKQTVQKMAKETQKNLVILGPGHLKTNLLEGLTPEVAASFLKSAFLLNGKGSVEPFWVDTATELCRNILGILSFLPGHYNLQSLYQFLFGEDTKKAILKETFDLEPNLPDKQKRLLKSYCAYYGKIFLNFDPKIQSGVYATAAQALSPFNHPDLMDAFCSNESTPIRMGDILEGKVYLVDLPLSIWGLGGKVAYTFIKLRFFNLMQNRHSLPQEHQDHPVFFMCDEFQEIISANRDGLSDLNFWDKSRSSKTIGIISSQSIASFYAALGSHDLAHAILQNFRQKICLRTEDPITLGFMENLIGHARVKKRSETRGHQHSSETLSDSREGVVDAQLFRELSPKQAVAILSLSGHSMDDVLTLSPVYTD